MNFILGLLLGWVMRKVGTTTPGGTIPGVPGGLPNVPGGLPNIPVPIPPIPGQTKPPPVAWPFPQIPSGWPWGTPPAGGAPPGGTPSGQIPIPGIENLPPPFTVPPTPTPKAQPAVHTYTIKSGDYPSGLSLKGTGVGNRWKELMTVNPEMVTYTDSKGQTQIKPWAPGQTIVVPPGWTLPGMT